MFRVESLLSARLFVQPASHGDHIYFISNLSGQLSLYRMADGGSVPEPLLPPDIALQNPDLIGGRSFAVIPDLQKILVMIDQDGDEKYRPMFIPLEGGYPEPAFGDAFDGYRAECHDVDLDHHIAYFFAQSNTEPLSGAVQANLKTGEAVRLGQSKYGHFLLGRSADHTKVIIADSYGAGDHVVYFKEVGSAEKTLIYGTPLENREPGQEVEPSSFGQSFFVNEDKHLLFGNSLYSDYYNLAVISLETPPEIEPVTIEGSVHEGIGELEAFEHIERDRYTVTYNIDGCTWLYTGRFDFPSRTMTLEDVIVGQPPLSGGILKGHHYNKDLDHHTLSFTTATSPTQIFTLDAGGLTQHTAEKVLGIPSHLLAAGEDASFTSFDGLRISARLYLPAAELELEAPYPLVYYIHGGPQSQEHPDFSWFSMPLIQLLTLRGFAVFVPNVRGSTGYGDAYMRHVIRDWGGQDRLDHVHAMTEVLPKDGRLDTSRAAVVGRSYGGFMTLTLATRHPELWSAACDMFGPYDLLSFASRVPETWKPFIAFMVGDPETEADFLRERSPKSYFEQLSCPLLVIQGKNDPRVVEAESAELVAELQANGKEVDYLMFEDEGHDVLKYKNRVTCYNRIVNFFEQHLMGG